MDEFIKTANKGTNVGSPKKKKGRKVSLDSK